MRDSLPSVALSLLLFVSVIGFVACGADGGSPEPMDDEGTGVSGSGGEAAAAGEQAVAGSGGTHVGMGSAGTAGSSRAGSSGIGGSTSAGGSPSSSTAGATSGGKTSAGGAGAGGRVEMSAGSGGGGAAGVAGSNNAGGSKSSGGAPNSAGSSAGGSTSSAGSNNAGSGNVPAIGPGPCGCTTPAGEFGTVNSTIIVKSGEVYDGKCMIYRANPSTLGSGDQSEGQSPVFRIEDGGTIRNVVLGASAADGIHTYGDAVLENIHWLDIGEDAMTVKQSGTVRLNCGSAKQGADKMFQVNAASDIFITNFTGKDAGKFMRQNGGTTFRINVTVDHCDISDMDEVIFRTDSTTSHVTLTNTRYSRLGKGLFMFDDNVVNGNSGQSTVSNNMAY